MKTQRFARPQRFATTYRFVAALLAGAAAVAALPAAAHAHGSLANGRMIQVRKAGPAGGTPAAWNDSYYTWNQNSRNFPNYADPGFAYSNYVADGALANAGTNDGTNGSLNFSGLNIASPGWTPTPATAGKPLAMRFLATAPHDPSYFDVWLTKQGFNPTTTAMGWGDVQYLGRWSVGDAGKPVTTTPNVPSPIDGSPMLAYDWTIPVPSDRSGREALLAVWQRVDPAGESFWAVQDLNVTAAGVPEPSTAMAGGAAAAGGLLMRRRRRRGSAAR
jgi:predicted carbohydrate-binding protein with CBM5 and CBM33 domain